MIRDTLLARLAEMAEMDDTPDYPRLASEVLGVRGARGELARRLVEQALVVEDRREIWRRTGDAICQRAPTSPGVYTLFDQNGCVLYVGKATNLRRRLRAHFANRNWPGMKPGMSRVERAEWEEVGSELEALLREASAICKLRPRLNTQVGPPSGQRMATPRSLVRDVLLILPSIEPDSAELIAARADGPVLTQRTGRHDRRLASHTRRLWQFFNRTIAVSAPAVSLAPIVFSWLAGRGAATTRVDPDDAASDSELRSNLETLLQDSRLFAERLVLGRHS
jgi:predicted GIY-YIG superfamily endonuclease